MQTLPISFEGHAGEYVVTISPVPVDALFAVNEALGRWHTKAGMNALKAEFAPFLASWPLDGDPSPETLGRLDVNLLIALVREWQTGVAEVPLPLPVKSSGGGQSAPPGDPNQ